MAFRITYTPRFEKNFKKLSDKERAQFKKKLKIFVENPFHPSVRTKRIQIIKYAFRERKTCLSSV